MNIFQWMYFTIAIMVVMSMIGLLVAVWFVFNRCNLNKEIETYNAGGKFTFNGILGFCILVTAFVTCISSALFSVSELIFISGERLAGYTRTVEGTPQFLLTSETSSDITEYCKENMPQYDLADYDNVVVTLSYDKIPFRDFLVYLVEPKRYSDYSTINLDYTHQTDSLELEGELVLSKEENQAIKWQIGDMQLSDNDILAKIGNNSNIKLKLVYNTSTAENKFIKDYKITEITPLT